MTKPKFIFPAAAFFLVCLFSFTASSAQTNPQTRQAEPSYEVVLQVLTASDAAADKSVVPQTLSNVVKKLKTTYPFSNYRVASTYLQRVANTGNIDFRGASNEANQDIYAPVFSDWSFNQLLAFPYTEPQNFVSIRNFKFGQRVPIKTAGVNDKSSFVVSYEAIGLSMQMLNLPVNTPTVIGTLSTPKSGELMFLILTVKPVEE